MSMSVFGCFFHIMTMMLLVVMLCGPTNTVNAVVRVRRHHLMQQLQLQADVDTETHTHHQQHRTRHTSHDQGQIQTQATYPSLSAFVGARVAAAATASSASARVSALSLFDVASVKDTPAELLKRANAYDMDILAAKNEGEGKKSIQQMETLFNKVQIDTQTQIDGYSQLNQEEAKKRINTDAASAFHKGLSPVFGAAHQVIDLALDDADVKKVIQDDMIASATLLTTAKMEKGSNTDAAVVLAGLSFLVEASTKPLLDAIVAAIKKHQSKFDQVAKLPVTARVNDKLKITNEIGIPGGPGNALQVSAGTGTIGVCLRYTGADVNRWNKRDKLITTFHGDVPQGAAVKFSAWYTPFALNVGEVGIGEHETSDWDLVSLKGGYECSCGMATATHYASAAQAEVGMIYDKLMSIQLNRGNSSMSAVGCRSGRMTPQILDLPRYGDPYRKIIHKLRGEPVLKNMWLFVTTSVSQHGDSGSSLVLNGQVIGILRGRIAADAQTIASIWVPIWPILLQTPISYEIC